MPDEFELSRRKALAAVGAVGVASVGAGLGTSAYFSDAESFENNQLTAGTLDMRVSWAEHYSDWSEDEAEHAHMEGGELVIDDQQGFMNATLQDQFPDKHTRAQLDAGEVEPCDVLADVPDDLQKPVVDLSDVKPGDFGEVTFGFALCDNPGYVWMNGELLENAENGTTEPEADDPGEAAASGELADAIETTIWYDNNCDNTETETRPCIEEVTKPPHLPPVCTTEVLSVPDHCDWFDPEDVPPLGESGIAVWCELNEDDEFKCPIDNEKVWVVDSAHGACCIRIDAENHSDCKPATDVLIGDEAFDWEADWTDEKCASPTETDEPQEYCVCEAEVIAFHTGSETCDDIVSLNETIYFRCEGEEALCSSRTCPLDPPEPTEEFPLTETIWLEHPDESREICQITVRYDDRNCSKDDLERVWDLSENWDKKQEQTTTSGTLRETMAVLSQDEGLPLDGRPVTPFDAVDDGAPASGDSPARECFDPQTRHCIGFKWELPRDVGNAVQSDSVAFDLGFYTEQCRHNEGEGLPPTVTEIEPISGPVPDDDAVTWCRALVQSTSPACSFDNGTLCVLCVDGEEPCPATEEFRIAGTDCEGEWLVETAGCSVCITEETPDDRRWRVVG